MPDRPPATTRRARALRRAQTDAEAKLWWRLRNRQVHDAKFIRQAPIGPYFADFLCREARLIIEVDGLQHDIDADAPRTAYLETRGFRLLRFSNHQVLQEIETVLDTIWHCLEELAVQEDPSPCPLPNGERVEGERHRIPSPSRGRG